MIDERYLQGALAVPPPPSTSRPLWRVAGVLAVGFTIGLLAPERAHLLIARTLVKLGIAGWRRGMRPTR
jgi:hypothetical protein